MSSHTEFQLWINNTNVKNMHLHLRYRSLYSKYKSFVVLQHAHATKSLNRNNINKFCLLVSDEGIF